MSEKRFTVQIQAGGGPGIWQALHPAETVDGTGEDTVESIALFVAGNQTVADRDGGRWRVAVWEGADADTGRPPAYSYEPGETPAQIEVGADCPNACEDGAHVPNCPTVTGRRPETEEEYEALYGGVRDEHGEAPGRRPAEELALLLGDDAARAMIEAGWAALRSITAVRPDLVHPGIGDFITATVLLGALNETAISPADEPGEVPTPEEVAAEVLGPALASLAAMRAGAASAGVDLTPPSEAGFELGESPFDEATGPAIVSSAPPQIGSYALQLSEPTGEEYARVGDWEVRRSGGETVVSLSGVPVVVVRGAGAVVELTRAAVIATYGRR